MFVPFLFVGLGGSGGKTLRTLHDDLTNRLKAKGWNKDFPKAWQFVYLDVPADPDGNAPDLPPQLPASQYQSLVPRNMTYRDLDSALWSQASGTELTRNALAGWRPRTSEVGIPVDRGAGQYRTIGRVLTLAALPEIKSRLQATFSTLQGPDIARELKELSTLFGDSAAPTDRAPVVVIVSSIAGGSGSGMFLDVADVVRSVGGPAGDHSIGLLYAPDVFDDLPEEGRKGVRPNAMAAVSELLAGYWNQAGPTQEQAALFNSAGILVGATGVSGPKYPMLVGRRNTRVSFGSQNDAYRAMGRALAAWVCDAKMQSDMDAFTVGNWLNNAVGVPDSLPFKLNTQPTPFSGLGFARVGLGRRNFRRYGAERLAREGVERALREHENRRADGDERDAWTLVTEAADIAFPSFLDATGLDERGPDKNQVLDALRAPGRNDVLKGVAEEIRRSLSTEVKPLKGDRWRSNIQHELQLRRSSGDVIAGQSLSQARAWVPAIERQLVDTTATYLARYGGPVTSRLLDRLDDDLEVVIGELQREASERRQWSHDAQALASVAELDAAVAASHPDVDAAIRGGVRYIEHLSEAELRDLARRLIVELRSGVLQPLRQAVTAAVELLTHDETTSVNGRPPVVRSWPAADELPNRFQPAVNERLLEPAGDYPRKLRQIVATTVGTLEEPAMRTAVQEILTGIMPTSTDRSPTQRLIDVRVPWVPADTHVLGDPGATPTRGEYRLALRPEDILERAEEWLDRPDTAVGRFVHETIGDHLRGDGAEAERRRERFTSELAATLDLAEPLVQINVGILGQAHRGRTEPALHRILTPLPFGTGHPARPAVRDLLLTRGWTDANVDSTFADTDKEEIDVFAMLAEPYEPVVFDSLMRPIAEEWGARSGDPDSRSAFWRWRRTRPLPQALPMTEAVRAAMIRGWFTGNLLGQVRTVDTGATSVFLPSGTAAPGSWAQFPYPFLGEMNAEHERLPAVLKSSMLAMLNANTQRSLAPLSPYARLRRLGSSGGSGTVDSYEVLNEELANWLLDGRLPSGAPTPRPEIAGAPDSTAEQRARALISRLDKQRTAYHQLFVKTDARADEFDVLRAWELRADYDNAFNALVRAISHAMTTAEDRDIF